MPDKKPDVERPEGTETPDARETPTEEMPGDFLSFGTGDDLGPAAAVEAQLTKEEPAEEEPESTEEEPEAEGPEATEEETEEETTEVSEEQDSPRKGGKSRSQRRKEQKERDETHINVLEAELASYKRMEPKLNLILNDPELNQAIKNRMAGKPLGESEFKIPEKPTPPVRPANFSRERAIEDPESPDAKYLDAVDKYPVEIEQWREDRENIEADQKADATRKEKERQSAQAQNDWFKNLQSGLKKAAQNDKTIPSDEVDEAVAEAIEVLGNPEAYSPTVLWQFAQHNLGRAQAVKKAKTIPPKKPVKAPPPPPSSDAAMPKGWAPKEGDEADSMEQEWLNQGI